MPAMGKAGFGRVYRANFHGKFQKIHLGKANKKAPQPVGLSAFLGAPKQSISAPLCG